MYRQEGRRRSRFCKAKVLRELDTVVSGKTKGACFATFIERKTRMYTAVKMPDRTKESMETAIKQIYNSLPSKAFITATTDRGGEFACFKNIETDLKVKGYYIML